MTVLEILCNLAMCIVVMWAYENIRVRKFRKRLIKLISEMYPDGRVIATFNDVQVTVVNKEEK